MRQEARKGAMQLGKEHSRQRIWQRLFSRNSKKTSVSDAVCLVCDEGKVVGNAIRKVAKLSSAIPP